MVGHPDPHPAVLDVHVDQVPRAVGREPGHPHQVQVLAELVLGDPEEGRHVRQPGPRVRDEVGDDLEEPAEALLLDELKLRRLANVRLVETIFEKKILPRRILVGRDEAYEVLSPLARALGEPGLVQRVKRLKLLEEVRWSMGEFMRGRR